MINIGIIGYGYWGPNIARNFYACENAKLTSICDLNKKRLDLAESLYPGLKVYSNPKELITSRDVDAVAVVTPVFTHYELGKLVLENNKHLFMEKPFTYNTTQGEELINLAEKKGLILMVDHTFLFTGAVRKMREIIGSGELGNLLFYDSVRVNLGLFQHDINVIWDLAPHDISIMTYLIGQKPQAVSATGVKHFGRDFEDLAYLTVHFENNLIAHFHVNWLSPVKVRKTLISGDKKMLVWDDLPADEKVKVFDRGVEIKTADGVYKLLVSYRSGDIWVPKIENIEALKLEADYFIECIRKKQKPFNDGKAGLQVVTILKAADKSLKNEGKKISL